MRFQQVVSLFILASLSLNYPLLGLRTEKSHFLWLFKWVRFNIIHVPTALEEQAPAARMYSRWYVSADYLGKIQRKELTVVFKTIVNNGSADFVDLPVTTFNEASTKTEMPAFDLTGVCSDEKSDKPEDQLKVIPHNVTLDNEAKKFIVFFNVTCKPETAAPVEKKITIINVNPKDGIKAPEVDVNAPQVDVNAPQPNAPQPNANLPVNAPQANKDGQVNPEPKPVPAAEEKKKTEVAAADKKKTEVAPVEKHKTEVAPVKKLITEVAQAQKKKTEAEAPKELPQVDMKEVARLSQEKLAVLNEQQKQEIRASMMKSEAPIKANSKLHENINQGSKLKENINQGSKLAGSKKVIV